jgi:hypothetical protein
MRSGKWRWASARATGTSHQRRNAPCDDFGTAFELHRDGESVLVQAVSDGAGSASHARIGARLACCAVSRALRQSLSQKPLAEISDEDIRGWLDEVRDRIAHAAALHQLKPRSFAATLVCAVVGKTCSIVAHVGDGAFVYRKRGGLWRIASWPSQGEYANTTQFVTDEVLPAIAVSRISGRIVETAIFSDGLERLALAFDTQKPFEPFFETMLAPLRKSRGNGRNKLLSGHLRRFLDSSTVNARTDDDKTLILAKRVPVR